MPGLATIWMQYGVTHAEAAEKARAAGLTRYYLRELAKREEIAGRKGGYVRILKVENRASDNAPISRVSWVGATLDSTEALRYPEHILENIETVEEEDEA